MMLLVQSLWTFPKVQLRAYWPKSDGWPPRGAAWETFPAATPAGQEEKMKETSFKDQKEEL